MTRMTANIATLLVACQDRKGIAEAVTAALDQGPLIEKTVVFA